MPGQPQLLELIGLIYDAASEPAQWRAFLKRLAEVTRSTALYLHNRVPVDGDSGGGIAWDFDASFIRSHNAYYWKLSPSEITPISKSNLHHDVRTWREIVSYPGLRKTQFFNDWLRPQGVLDTFGAVVERAGLEGRAMFSGSRRLGDRHYDEDDLELFRLLRPHVHRAMLMNQRLAQQSDSIESMQDALDRVRLALLFVDRKGRVLRANRAAEDLVSRGNGLLVIHERLIAQEREASRTLERLIGSASETSNGVGSSAGSWMMVPRAGRQALPVLVSPLRPSRDGEQDRGATALVVISDPERAAAPPVDLLRRVFGLTRTEARVVSLLVDGKRPDEIAGLLSVQANTIRMHLKNVFAKTGTRRQAEIVLLVERTVGRVESAND